jgi:protein-S-isoprenylcysteine O-methyltransferase Ste14
LQRNRKAAILGMHVVTMFVVVRAVTFAALFIGLVLIYVPAQFLLPGSGLVRPAAIGAAQIAGMTIGSVGAAIALWCVFTFAFVGKGTPAPFDPPRRLVIRGPYRFVRNPMYIVAGLALAGAALFYGSWSILIYAGVFLLVLHLFVVGYEEPTLRRTFGAEYESYCRQVRRWWPKRVTSDK